MPTTHALDAPVRGSPSEYRRDVWYAKTRMVSLPDGEKILKICLLVLTEFTNVTDRQTDRRTPHDGIDCACINDGDDGGGGGGVYPTLGRLLRYSVQLYCDTVLDFPRLVADPLHEGERNNAECNSYSGRCFIHYRTLSSCFLSTDQLLLLKFSCDLIDNLTKYTNTVRVCICSD